MTPASNDMRQHMCDACMRFFCHAHGLIYFVRLLLCVVCYLLLLTRFIIAPYTKPAKKRNILPKRRIDRSIKLDYKDGYNFGLVHVAHYDNRGPNEWSAKCNTVPNKTNKLIARIRRKRVTRRYEPLCIRPHQNAALAIRVHFTYRKREHTSINSYSLLSWLQVSWSMYFNT